jgi:hypothetical protein
MKIEALDNMDSLNGLLDEWYTDQNGEFMGLDMNIETFCECIKAWLKSFDGVILVAINKEPVGFLVLVKLPSEFGEQVWGVEKGWYALPNTGAGLKLYRAAERWCRENGCSHLIMTASNAASGLHDKVGHFYERMGMTKFETSYLKDL